MRLIITSIVFFCMLFLATCTKPNSGDNEIEESAAVYSVAINEAFSRSVVETIYISTKASTVEGNETGLYEGNFDKQISRLQAVYASVDEEVLRSFLSKHQKAFEFDPETKLRLNKTYKFLDGIEVEKEWEKSVLESSEVSKLPGDVLVLSRIGFNSSYNKAFLKLGYSGIGGFGTSYLLEKKSGKWIIKESFVGYKV